MALVPALEQIMSAVSPALAGALFVLFIWWFSTGAILHALRRPHWHDAALVVATLLAFGAIVAIALTRSQSTPAGALVGFAAALALWGWNEVLFLTGRVLGPWRKACPEGLTGWPRFRLASLAIIHHEIVLVGSLVLVGIIAAAADNPTAFWTFAMLWVLRLSAKLNIFFGVPNPAEDMLPPGLTHLASFFTRRPMNPLWPVSIAVSTLALVVLLGFGRPDLSSDHETMVVALLATLLALGILEHVLLLVPFPVSKLFSWKTTGFAATAPDATAGPKIALATGGDAAVNLRGLPPPRLRTRDVRQQEPRNQESIKRLEHQANKVGS